MTRGETFVSGALGSVLLAGGLALAAALSLAPDAARAQEECGALNSGNSFTETCPNQAYADGIVYDAQANGITLTVTGGAATTITASTGAHNSRDNGIFLRTASSATNAPIGLTVGSGGAVAIVQGSSPDANNWHKNHGIVVAPLTSDGAATTVDVRSGVTIGTSTTPMANSGVYLRTTGGAGDVSVTSAATIYSDKDGILIDNPAGAYTTAGTVTVVNSGAVTSDDDAIRVNHGGTGPLVITNSGDLTSSGTASSDHGIYVWSHNKDTAGTSADLTITHSAGTISATDGGRGIRVEVGGGTAQDTGLAKVSVTGGAVRSKKDAVSVRHSELGSVEVNTSSGVTLTATEGHGIYAELASASNTSGTISVTSAAAITAGTTENPGYHGIYAYRAGGSGAVTVDNRGAIAASSNGILAWAGGAGGTVSVTNSGALTVEDDGIHVEHQASAGDVVITSSGAITSAGTGPTDHGIYAHSTNKDTAGTSAGISVTHSAGTISAVAGGSGIAVFMDDPREEADPDHADYVAPVNTGLAKVSVTGGSVRSKGSAIRVRNTEAGSVEVEVGTVDDEGDVDVGLASDITLTATEGHGIEAELTDVGNTSGSISVTNAAAITAGTTENPGYYGIYVNRAGGSGAVTVDNRGAIAASSNGILAWAGGAGGTVSVTNSGALTVEDDGIHVEHQASAGDVVITSSGAITSAGTGSVDHGIYAYSANKDTAGTSAGISVTHSAGTISAVAGGSGIAVFMGHPREEADPDHADYVAPVNTGLAKVSVTGGSVRSKGSAIRVSNREAGSVEVRVSSGATLTATEGHGIEAELTDAGNTSGSISVTNAAAITAGTTENTGYHGIYAYRAGGGSGAVTVTSGGDVTARGRGHGIYASVGGTGLAKVEVTGGAVSSGKSAIRVRHRALGSAEVRVSSGATLTATDGHGIEVELAAGNTSRTISITNAATIAAGTTENTGWYGISASRQVGSGAVTVTNSGAVTAHGNGIHVGAGGAGGTVTVANRGAITAKAAGDGINVEHSATAGDVAISSSGAITVEGVESTDHGIYAHSSNKDTDGTSAGISVTHSAGTISAAAGGSGIAVFMGSKRQETAPTHDDYVAPENTGLAKVSVTGGSVRSKGSAIRVSHREAGSVEVEVGTVDTEGDVDVGLASDITLTATEGHGIEAELTDAGNTSGSISVTNAAAIVAGTTANTGYHGIYVHRGGGSGAVSVRNSGAVRASGHGIRASAEGAGGTVSVTNSGDIGTADAKVSRGIFVSHAGTGATGAVTVGNSGDIMANSDGIRVRQTGTGTVTVASSGDITAMGLGILVDKPGSAGAVSITHSGGAITADDVGIGVEHHGATGGTTIVNRGDVTSATAKGIYVYSTNKNAAGTSAGISVTHSAGTISAPSDHGIAVYLGGDREVTDPDHADYVAPMNTGLVKVEVTGGSINAKGRAVNAFNREAGSVEVRVSKGVTLTSTQQDGIRAELTDLDNTSGTLTVNNAGTITASSGDGIYAGTNGRGAISVTNAGALKTGDKGITVEHHGTAGDVTVVNRANIESAAGVRTNHDGIYAFSSNKDAPGTSAGISITHSAGTISAPGGVGIAAWLGSYRAERWRTHPSYATPINTGLVKVEVTGGSIRSRGDAVKASNREDGSVEVNVGTVNTETGNVDASLPSDITLTATEGDGIDAELIDVGNTSGTVTVTNAGTIAAGTTANVGHGISAEAAGPGGAVKVTHRGAITASGHGISAKLAAGNSAEVTGNAMAAPDRTAIDVVWTGTFKALEGQRREPLQSVTHAVEVAAGQQAVKEAEIRFAQGSAGIDAGVMKWQTFMRPVSEGDDPGSEFDKAAQDALFAADADAATKARAATIVAQLRSVLTDESLGTIPGADAIDADDDDEYSDEEIVAYLSEDDGVRRTLLRYILAQSFTEHEMAVFRSVLEGGDVEAALAAVPAGYGDAWKAEVRALLAHRNDGNIRIAMNGGAIDSKGDGIRAFFGRPHADNGRIDVTVAEGASVTGGMAGVYVANAGEGLRIEKRYTSPAVQDRDENRDLGADDLVTLADHLAQVVTVDGTVTGGTDAAVHLAGGGALIVSRTGKLVAGSSGRAVLVNDPGPAVIWIEGEARGGEGAAAAVHLTGGGSVTLGLNGRVQANGAGSAIRGDNEPTAVVVHTERTVGDLTQGGAEQILARVEGGYAGDGIEEVTIAEVRDGVTTGHMRKDLPVDQETGEVDVGELPEDTFKCDRADDGRCRLYEALPSMLLSMNGLPSYAERMSAARDANGGWARVEAARGKWQAKKATTSGKLAYDHRRTVGRAGFDLIVGEDISVGGSLQVLRGKAEMSGAGEAREAELDGEGVALSATWLPELHATWLPPLVRGEPYVDAQAGVTRYDVDLESAIHGELVKDADATGYALGVEAGHRMAFGEGGLTVTPRAGLSWSKVDLKGFTDRPGTGAVVTMKDARSTKGRLGVLVETEAGSESFPGRVFGSLDVEREFSDDTEVVVSGDRLETKVRPTALRVGLGGVFNLDEDLWLRASASYTTSGSGTREFGGGVELHMRF